MSTVWRHSQQNIGYFGGGTTPGKSRGRSEYTVGGKNRNTITPDKAWATHSTQMPTILRRLVVKSDRRQRGSALQLSHSIQMASKSLRLHHAQITRLQLPRRNSKFPIFSSQIFGIEMHRTDRTFYTQTVLVTAIPPPPPASSYWAAQIKFHLNLVCRK